VATFLERHVFPILSRRPDEGVRLAEAELHV
jgi:hypothetical protein